MSMSWHGLELRPRSVLQPAVGDNCLELKALPSRRLCTAAQNPDSRQEDT